MLPNKKFISRAEQARQANSIWGKYMAGARKNSLVYVGIPFFTIMLMGTYLLTEFASVRYEQHDRRATEVEEANALQGTRRKRQLDIKEEYYRLQQLDTDNWEQKRVTRLPGESENKW